MGDFNHDQFNQALKYAKDLWESVDIMEDKNGAFIIIRVHGVPHWEQQGYKTVTKVRLTHVIEGRGAAQETKVECAEHKRDLSERKVDLTELKHPQETVPARSPDWCDDCPDLPSTSTSADGSITVTDLRGVPHKPPY